MKATKAAKPAKPSIKSDKKSKVVESVSAALPDLEQATYKPNIGKSDEQRKAVAEALNILLADEHILYVKTRNYHWNIEGPNFLEMHRFLEEIYNDLALMIDEIAERIRKVGHYAQGSLQEFLNNARLKENEYTSKQRQQLGNLLNDHETIIRELREMVKTFDEEYEDAGTADFVTGLMEKHEKWAWFLRSYLN